MFIRKISYKTVKVFVSSGLVVMCLIGSGGTPSFAASQANSSINAKTTRTNFSDLTGHWAEQIVKDALAKGTIEGYPDDTFKPDKSVSRAEFIKLLVMATSNQTTQETQNALEWYKPYITQAKNSHFMEDSDFPDGDWNKEMTRFEMARIAVRAAKADTFLDETKRKIISNIGFFGGIDENGREYGKKIPVDNNNNDGKWMFMATQAGLMQGVDNKGNLGKELSTNRAQSVVVIERVLKYMHGDKLDTDTYAITQADLEWRHTNIFSKWPMFFNQGRSYLAATGEKIFAKPEDLWIVDDMTIQHTYNGKPYKGVVDELILVDWNDPNDPYRYLVGDPNAKPIIEIHDGNIDWTGSINEYLDQKPKVAKWLNFHIDEWIEKYKDEPAILPSRARGEGGEPYDPNMKAYVLVQKAHHESELTGKRYRDPSISIEGLDFSRKGFTYPSSFEVHKAEIFQVESGQVTIAAGAGSVQEVTAKFIPKDLNVMKYKDRGDFGNKLTLRIQGPYDWFSSRPVSKELVTFNPKLGE
ncbi:S-layer homology domain-containing protein [Paenibacillus sp. SYP-B3998]|uniref:S-layer homology domain-containing protein n=1 Tax=Paenibacillus sp. SYP-B3998 TaxID=2678564 RepID=A0A6G4A2M3_9BACL|nr:S-layer homology domain-containing protein [Paenibacillus sp. SYP-B3998]NEW07897.1 S-layer homology domain-containing protein [Paenibacillus sp. SYP-B3998]